MENEDILNTYIPKGSKIAGCSFQICYLRKGKLESMKVLDLFITMMTNYLHFVAFFDETLPKEDCIIF